MQVKLTLLALFGIAAAVAIEPAPAPTNTKCNADNCARALTGTQFGATRASTRISQCTAFQTTTVVPGVTTTVTQTPTVPAFASACMGPSAFASACSCAGVTSATVTAVPTAFRIAARDEAGVLKLAGLGRDTQEFGSTDGPVLSEIGSVGGPSQLISDRDIFSLGPQGQLRAGTGQTAYAYPGSASKFYFSGSAPMVGSNTYLIYSCSLGAFDATANGYLLTCTNPTGGGQRGIRQAQGNYGVAQPGFDEAPPQGPDVTVTFFAVQS